MQRPAKTPPAALAPDQPDLLFQPTRPFRAGALIRQHQRVPQFIPSRPTGMKLKMALKGGLEFEVGHEGSWNALK